MNCLEEEREREKKKLFTILDGIIINLTNHQQINKLPK